MGTYNVNNGVITPVDKDEVYDNGNLQEIVVQPPTTNPIKPVPMSVDGKVNVDMSGLNPLSYEVGRTMSAELPATTKPATKKPTTLQGYIDELSTYMPSISQEEIERRKRKAYMTEGIGHLGNALAALGNVYYTGKGAPSQASGKVQRMDEEADKLDQTEYAKRLNAYKLAQANMQQDYANEIAKQKNVLEQWRLTNQDRREIEALNLKKKADARSDAEFELKYPGYVADAEKKKIEAANAQRKADDAHKLSQVRANNYNNGGRGGGNRADKYEETSYDFDVNWGNLNLASLYDEVVKAGEHTPAPSILAKETAADKKTRMQQDVLRYLNNHPERRQQLKNSIRSRASSQQTRTQSQGSSLGVSGSGNRGNQRSSSSLGVSGSK